MTTTTENPFTEPSDEELFDEDVEGTSEAEDVTDLDVDTPDVGGAEDSAPAPEAEKPKATASTSTRAAVPDGYMAPVAFAKALADHLHSFPTDSPYHLDADKVIAPQVVYSYIKNSQGGKNPFPVYSAGGRDWLLKLDDDKQPAEGLKWWRDKIDRVAASKVNAAAKAAKKAAKPAEGTEAKAEDTGPVEEAE